MNPENLCNVCSVGKTVKFNDGYKNNFKLRILKQIIK